MEKFQSIVFYTLLVFLPTQLGKHFWPDFAYVSGIRIDYISPTVYFTDILLLLLFFQHYFFSSAKKRFAFVKTKGFFLFCLFFLWMAVVSLSSKNPQVGIYGTIRFLEFSFFAFYVATRKWTRQLTKNVGRVFAIGILFESFLVLLQYLNNGAVGGIFYFFGERWYTPQTLGIAQSSINGLLLLRPYGTFSHPNVLAGYLVIVLIFIIGLFPIFWKRFDRALFLLAVGCGSIALFATLTRFAIIVWAISMAGLFVGHFGLGRRRIAVIKVIIIITIVVFSSFFLSLPQRFLSTSFQEQSFVVRDTLQQSALNMIFEKPVFGVGMYNFIPSLPKYLSNTSFPLYTVLQPVHNIFLLTIAQTGIIGGTYFVFFFVYVFWNVFKNKDTLFLPELLILLAALAIGMQDHYFLTIQQGQMLLAFVIGFCFAKKVL